MTLIHLTLGVGHATDPTDLTLLPSPGRPPLQMNQPQSWHQMLPDVGPRYWGRPCHSRRIKPKHFDLFWLTYIFSSVLGYFNNWNILWIVMKFYGNGDIFEVHSVAWQPEARHHWRPCISFLSPQQVEGHSKVSIPQRTSVWVILV